MPSCSPPMPPKRATLRLREHPDVALLDIWMPGTDGISLLREWAEGGALAACPVIMMSGHGTVETAVEATRLGAYDFIEKPISLAKAAADDFARARSQPSAPRERRLAAKPRAAAGTGRQQQGDARAARADGKTRAARYVRADPRRARHRQGIDRALAARTRTAPRWTLHHRRAGDDSARASRRRAVRCGNRPTACSTVCSNRPTAARCFSTKWPNSTRKSSSACSTYCNAAR